MFFMPLRAFNCKCLSVRSTTVSLTLLNAENIRERERKEKVSEGKREEGRGKMRGRERGKVRVKVREGGRVSILHPGTESSPAVQTGP